MKILIGCLLVLTIVYGGCNQKEEKNLTHSVDQIKKQFEPAYLALHRSGELKKRAEELWHMMQACSLCPRFCRVNRLKEQKGFCGASAELRVASYYPHFGEERTLVGQKGSGAIFFTHCSLRCVFCINWEISHAGAGSLHSVEELAEMMLRLQSLGTHNINLVTPSHYLPHILLAVDIAAAKGLRVPLVYNTCGWERLEILKMLDGIIDIYLPDLKYWDNEMAIQYSSGADGYPQMNREAILEMYRQVGTAKINQNGLISRGLMIRHLIMPNNVSGTKEIIHWIAENLPKDTYLNLMPQYRPMYQAFNFPAIARRITQTEYQQAIIYAQDLGLTNLDHR